MELTALLERLCEPLGPAGREDEVRQVISDLLTPAAHRLESDRLGNLQAWLNPQSRPRLMLDAHMDEVGFMVQRIDGKGFLALAPLGGLEARLAPGCRVLLQPRPGRRLPGVVGLAPPHVAKQGEADKAPGWEQLVVDTGLPDAEAVRAAGVEVGTPGVIEAGFLRLGQGSLAARNLDDRAGCALLVEAFLRLAADPPPWGLVANFAVAEEVGLRGAATAAYALEPDLALVLETTMGDTPGLEPNRQPSQLGQGPAITVADGRHVVPWSLVESLEQAAQKAGVPCQRKLPIYGGTDAGAIAYSRGGVPTAIISVPARYIHTPVSLLRIADLKATSQTLQAWLQTAGELM